MHPMLAVGFSSYDPSEAALVDALDSLVALVLRPFVAISYYNCVDFGD